MIGRLGSHGMISKLGCGKAPHCPHMKKIVIFLLSMMFAANATRASTIWGATGDDVAGGGSLIAKNLDASSLCYTRLELVHPHNGYKHLANVLHGAGASPCVEGGVNEKGLVVVSAEAILNMAYSQKSINRRSSTGGRLGLGFNDRILCNYGSVNELLRDKDIFRSYHPGFFLIGDKHELVLVEVTPTEHYSVQVVKNGPMCHANDYLTEAFHHFNQIQLQGTSSRERFSWIGRLLAKRDATFTMDDFLAMSEDQHDGPTDSIWRAGDTPTGTRTLSTWIVGLPLEDAPTVYLKTANRGEKIKSTRMTLDRDFWESQPAGEISF